LKIARFIVSGSSGFVGSRLVNKLSEFGEVFPLYRSSISGETAGFPEEADVFYHVAGMKGVAATEAAVEECVSANIEYTIKMLEEARRRGCTKFVMFSTHKAFRPDGVYGASKLVAEKLAKSFCALNNIKYSSVRCGNIAWSPNSVLDKWFAGQVVIGNPKSSIFIQSLNKCCDEIIECGDNIVEKLSIPKSVTMGELGEAFAAAHGKSIIISNSPETHEEIGFDQNRNLISSLNSDRISEEELNAIITNKN
jgi:nucleoside-diphosphate-sugar epimerase